MKNPHAVALGRLGGLKGGPSRAKSLTKKRRREIAMKAAETRWRGSKWRAELASPRAVEIIDKILNDACTEYGIDEEDLLSAPGVKTKNKQVQNVRYIIMYKLREFGLSIIQISEIMQRHIRNVRKGVLRGKEILESTKPKKNYSPEKKPKKIVLSEEAKDILERVFNFYGVSLEQLNKPGTRKDPLPMLRQFVAYRLRELNYKIGDIQRIVGFSQEAHVYTLLDKFEKNEEHKNEYKQLMK